jgi:hypothetical protein
VDRLFVETKGQQFAFDVFKAPKPHGSGILAHS